MSREAAAFALAPRIEVAEALLAGDEIPVECLDQEWVQALRFAGTVKLTDAVCRLVAAVGYGGAHRKISPESFIAATKESALPQRNESSGEGLPFAPLAEVVQDTPPEPAWVWDGYVARGALTLFAGRPKVGKSTLVFGLLRALAVSLRQAQSPSAAIETSAGFAGRGIAPTGALLLTEEREGTLAEKARRFKIDTAANVHVLLRHQAGSASWPEAISQAVAYCHQHQLGLLVIDVLDKWAPLGGDDENSAGATVAALLPLLQAAGEGLAVLLVTYQRKSGGTHGEAVRGSNAITGTVDIVVELERLPGSTHNPDGSRVIRAVSRFAGTPEELVVILGDDDYTAAGDLDEARATSERLAVLDALHPDTPATVAEVAEECGISEREARRRLDELVGHGLADRDGAGKRGSPYTWRLRSAR